MTHLLSLAKVLFVNDNTCLFGVFINNVSSLFLSLQFIMSHCKTQLLPSLLTRDWAQFLLGFSSPFPLTLSLTPAQPSTNETWKESVLSSHGSAFCVISTLRKIGSIWLVKDGTGNSYIHIHISATLCDDCTVGPTLYVKIADIDPSNVFNPWSKRYVTCLGNPCQRCKTVHTPD